MKVKYLFSLSTLFLSIALSQNEYSSAVLPPGVWEMTVEVKPQTEWCFITLITTLGPLIIEYTVVDSKGKLGQNGELDINFRVTGPLVKKEGGSVATVLHSENKQGER